MRHPPHVQSPTFLPLYLGMQVPSHHLQGQQATILGLVRQSMREITSPTTPHPSISILGETHPAQWSAVSRGPTPHHPIEAKMEKAATKRPQRQLAFLLPVHRLWFPGRRSLISCSSSNSSSRSSGQGLGSLPCLAPSLASQQRYRHTVCMYVPSGLCTHV